MKRHTDQLRNLAYQEHFAYENSSSSSDSDDDKNNEPDIPHEVDEIEGNFLEIAAFLVHVVSLPIHDLDLRAKKMNLVSGKYVCFCPFGKVMKKYKMWVTNPSYEFLLEKTCPKNSFNNGQALIAHCRDAGDWYHHMYYTFLQNLYPRRFGGANKRKSKVTLRMPRKR